MLELLKQWLGITKVEGKDETKLEVKDISLQEVKRAVERFAKEKPEGVHLSVLMKDNQEIDYSLLTPYLQAIPKQPYFMSRETYEIFDEPTMPRMLDNVQKAVDQYINREEKFPLVDGNPNMKVCYYKLKPYLTETPMMDTYLTAEENLITWRKPME